MDKVTAPAVKAAKGGDKLRMVTAYDAPSARIADRAGADIILVGDSLANVVLGYESTPQVTMDEMIHHTAAVTRTNPRALVVGDMPWMSYHVSNEDTIRNAGRFVQEGGVGAVKLEGGVKRVRTIEMLVDIEIPVMGHIGLTPQSVHAMGGYKVQGRGLEDAYALMDDAQALAEAGVFSMVLEGVPDVVAQMITDDIDLPTIGIGAGAQCDGQVLVFHDVLGLHDGHLPKFVRKYADLAETAVGALESFFGDIQDGTFPAEAETYHLSDEVAAALREGRKPSDG